jgi:hypothetical protein
MHVIFGLVRVLGVWTGLAVAVALLIALLANPGNSIALTGGVLGWLWEAVKPILQPQILALIGIWMIWLVLREILQTLQSINAQLGDTSKRERP